MALRLMEVTVSSERKERAEHLFKENDLFASWFGESASDQLLAKVVLPAEKTEQIMDSLEKDFGRDAGFRIILLSLEAVVPRPVEKETFPSQEELEKMDTARVSREELYHDIVDSTKINHIYIVMVLLSTLVAAFGILYENVAAIIGAMVIAPLLGPNVALSLATTLGDFELARKSIKVNLTGLVLALILSVILGKILPLDIHNLEIAVRTQVRPGDLVLALASGSAGALAFTTGVPATLIGVMVAVALLPPLVVMGLLLGASHFSMAVGAGLLLLTNVICVNLAGVVTFLFQGIRPLSWWEKGKAKKATLWAILLWAVLFMSLMLIILFSNSQP